MLQAALVPGRCPRHDVGPLDSESGPPLCDFRTWKSLLDQRGQGQVDCLALVPQGLANKPRQPDARWRGVRPQEPGLCLHGAPLQLSSQEGEEGTGTLRASGGQSTGAPSVNLVLRKCLPHPRQHGDRYDHPPSVHPHRCPQRDTPRTPRWPPLLRGTVAPGGRAHSSTTASQEGLLWASAQRGQVRLGTSRP